MAGFKYFKSKQKAEKTQDVKKKCKRAEKKKELEEAKEQLLRKVAEFENFRKRKAKDVVDAREYGKSSAVEEFLTVYDHFKMAMTSVENGDSIEIISQGMTMIFNEFKQTFENIGVKEVNAVGEKFDPLKHEAISEQASEDVPAGEVLQQWKSGYTFGDKLLRPATVVVSSGPAVEEEATTEEEETK